MAKHYSDLMDGWLACPECGQIIDFKEYKNGVPAMWTCETPECEYSKGKHDLMECSYCYIDTENVVNKKKRRIVLSSRITRRGLHYHIYIPKQLLKHKGDTEIAGNVQELIMQAVKQLTDGVESEV